MESLESFKQPRRERLVAEIQKGLSAVREWEVLHNEIASVLSEQMSLIKDRRYLEGDFLECVALDEETRMRCIGAHNLRVLNLHLDHLGIFDKMIEIHDTVQSAEGECSDFYLALRLFYEIRHLRGGDDTDVDVALEAARLLKKVGEAFRGQLNLLTGIIDVSPRLESYEEDEMARIHILLEHSSFMHTFREADAVARLEKWFSYLNSGCPPERKAKTAS